MHKNQFDHYLAQEKEFLDDDPEGKVHSRLLDQLIRERLVLQEAKRLGISAAPNGSPETEPASAVSDVVEPLPNDDLLKTRVIVDSYQHQMVLKDVSASAEEIASYYQQNQVRFARRSGYYLRDIRVADRAQAENIFRQISKLNGDFAQLAKEFSLSPTAADGGLRYYEDGQLPPVFEEVVQKLSPGQVSTIVPTEYGFHIFKLERRAEPLTLDQSRDQIKQELIASKSQALLDADSKRLQAKAKVKLYTNVLDFRYTGDFGRK
ncbi:MAG TPA: peptidyl-prolyl cis-trans isomerase [Blastocatellia bacterium]|nr:peptidyl-prolyl cis-trans isomerase [Blastocatellia bacterium]